MGAGSDRRKLNLLFFHCRRMSRWLIWCFPGESSGVHTPVRYLAFLFFAILTTSLNAVEIVGAPAVEVHDSSAIIRWKTDAECGTRLRIGTSADALNRKEETPGVGVDHVVAVEGLQPGVTYFFSVGTSKKSLASGSFTTSGRGNKPTATSKPAPAQAKQTPNSTAPAKAPPTKKIWGKLSTLQDHFDRHGRDFKAATPDDYARMSWEFLQRAMDEGLPAKFDEADNTIRVWDAKSHTFGAYNRDFTTKTFFKPESPTYFERQPGKPVRLKRKE